MINDCQKDIVKICFDYVRQKKTPGLCGKNNVWPINKCTFCKNLCNAWQRLWRVPFSEVQICQKKIEAATIYSQTACHGIQLQGEDNVLDKWSPYLSLSNGSDACHFRSFFSAPFFKQQMAVPHEIFRQKNGTRPDHCALSLTSSPHCSNPEVRIRKKCSLNLRLLWERPWKELQNEPPHDIAGP